MTTEINVLKLTLHGHLVGYLAGAKNGRNVLHFAESYKSNLTRPTFSLTIHPSFPRADKSNISKDIGRNCMTIFEFKSASQALGNPLFH